MIETEDLGRLESVVEKLLTDFNNLKKENSELEELLEQQQGEINKLQATLDEVQSDRTQVQQRVSGILNSIEQWEKSQTPEQPTDDSEERTEGKPESSPQLFSMGK
jgi:predicted nuclease with TOPRIM domain